MNNPPVNNKENAPLQGGNTLKVDRLGLGPEVRELKLSGQSDEKIVEELNEAYSLTGVNKLNKMTVWRWCKRNNIDREAPLGAGAVVDVLKEECDILSDINDALECVQYELSQYKESINDGKPRSTQSMKDILFALEKLAARKQALLTSVKVTYEKMKTYDNFVSALTLIMNIVKEHDLKLYAAIVAKIKEDVVIQEVFRKVKES